METTLDEKEKLLKNKQKLTRAAGWILAIDALGLLLCRILAGAMSQADLFAGMDTATAELITEAIFDVFVQIGFCFGSAYLITTLYLNKDFKSFLSLSNVTKPSLASCLIAIPIGLLAPCLSSLVNVLVLTALSGAGVSLPSSSSLTLPAEFSVWFFLAYVVLTAVLPAICEEFLNRGVVLTALRGMFPEWATVLLGGLVFGLFHQYIYQIGYTAVFGMIMVYITLKTKSVVPAMIIHFINNFTSVLTEFAQTYNWNVFSLIDWIASQSNSLTILVLLILGTGALFGAIAWLVKADKASKKKQLLAQLHWEGAVNPDQVEIEEVGGQLRDTVFYKPTIKDTAMWWVACFLAAATTVLTLVSFML